MGFSYLLYHQIGMDHFIDAWELDENNGAGGQRSSSGQAKNVRKAEDMDPMKNMDTNLMES